MQYRCLVASLLTLLLGRSYVEGATIELILSATTVTAGSQLNATCVTLDSTLAVSLRINGVTVDETDRITYITEGVLSSWIFDPVQREDAGEYICTGTASDSEPQTVIVYFVPIVILTMVPENVSENQAATVDIAINAVLFPSDISVVVPMQAQTPTVSPNEAASSATIMFSSVNRFNNGMYNVTVTNNVGSGTVDFQLVVYFGAVFSHDGEVQANGASISVTAGETDEFTVTCYVEDANPVVPSLSLAPPPMGNVGFNEGTGVITITDVTLDDEGTYTCTADNGVSTPTTISFVLTVNPTTPSPSPSPTPDGAENVLGTITVTIVMLLAALLLS